MDSSVRHQPRVAFDAARILVDMSGADAGLFAWYGDQLAVLLGPSYRRELLATRNEVVSSPRVNARDVEGGKWRVRLEDVLRARPDVAESLHQLTLSARVRLPRVG
ncbi:hypothetical protein [Catellatospora sichuanensis]|uniref:hypothetical protein n=1 Tax=Catellatospora sichuanensis TaxID=1969805 RepID=UPI001FE508E6|nr:hypothetical protein [Catellatospora sichuanensis]